MHLSICVRAQKRHAKACQDYQDFISKKMFQGLTALRTRFNFIVGFKRFFNTSITTAFHAVHLFSLFRFKIKLKLKI